MFAETKTEFKEIVDINREPDKIVVHFIYTPKIIRYTLCKLILTVPK